MKYQALLLTATLLFSRSDAVFSDDAFHVDYHQALLGIPQSHTTFFHKPQSSSNASLLYTISDKGVLGAVNPRDGSLIWRQALAGLSKHVSDTFLVAGDADGRITSGIQSSVQSWDALDGRLNWGYNFESGFAVKGIQPVPTVAQGAEDIVQDIVAIGGPIKAGSAAYVVRLAGDGTAARWEYHDKSASSDTAYSIATSPKYVYYITKSSGILSGGKAKVTVIDITTGKEISQYSISVDAETFGADGSLSLGSGSDAAFILSAEKPFKSLKFNLLGNSKTSTVALEDKGEEVNKLTVHYAGGHDSASHFLVHAHGKTKQWAEVFHINKKTGDVSRAYSLPATAEVSTFAATAVGPAIYFTRITDSEVALFSSESHGHIGRWPRSGRNTQTQPDVLHATTEVSSRGAGSVALRVALSSSATGWSLIRNGDQAWSRPEMLAYVTRAIWSNDLQATALAQEIEAEAASNPMTAYVHRLTRHLQDLKHLPMYLAGVPNSILQPVDDNEKTTREKLIGSKLILATTSRGEVFALDATNAAAVRWSTILSEAGPSTAQAVHLATEENRLTVYLSNGEIVVVDISSGNILERQRSSKPFEDIVELPGQPASTIVRVNAAGKPEVFAELAPATPTEGSVLVTINDKGEAIGWSVGASVEQIWTLRPENGAKVTDVVARSSHDPVASIGTVLGDRSVMYKYINPNVAMLTALSSTALTVYLINAVTGAILHTATHESVLTELPVTAVASGNKFAYSFTTHASTNTGLTTQIIASDLYESEFPNDRGMLATKANYSSYSPDAGAKPYVFSQAFTVAEPLSTLTMSQTIQGITSRQIIAYLANSQALVSIPSEALNARRPVGRDATADEMEEGLMRYSPTLELDPKYFISHSREIVGVKNIMTSPTVLESTSIVFAFGHDIFGTQVAPSNTFDVLGKGFKRIQLVLTVVALYMGVLALRPIARKKIVERRWH